MAVQPTKAHWQYNPHSFQLKIKDGAAVNKVYGNCLQYLYTVK